MAKARYLPLAITIGLTLIVFAVLFRYISGMLAEDYAFERIARHGYRQPLQFPIRDPSNMLAVGYHPPEKDKVIEFVREELRDKAKIPDSVRLGDDIEYSLVSPTAGKLLVTAYAKNSFGVEVASKVEAVVFLPIKFSVTWADGARFTSSGLASIPKDSRGLRYIRIERTYEPEKSPTLHSFEVDNWTESFRPSEDWELLSGSPQGYPMKKVRARGTSK